MTTTAKLVAVKDGESKALELAHLVEQASAYAASARADSTRRAYASDWRSFAAWCAAQGLSALDVADLAFVPEGLEATVGRSKTDQEGRGQVKAIPFGSSPATCPVRAVKAWLEAGGILEGALFRELGRAGIPGDRLSSRGV